MITPRRRRLRNIRHRRQSSRTRMNINRTRYLSNRRRQRNRKNGQRNRTNRRRRMSRLKANRLRLNGNMTNRQNSSRRSRNNSRKSRRTIRRRTRMIRILVISRKRMTIPTTHLRKLNSYHMGQRGPSSRRRCRSNMRSSHHANFALRSSILSLIINALIRNGLGRKRRRNSSRSRRTSNHKRATIRLLRTNLMRMNIRRFNKATETTTYNLSSSVRNLRQTSSTGRSGHINNTKRIQGNSTRRDIPRSTTISLNNFMSIVKSKRRANMMSSRQRTRPFGSISNASQMRNSIQVTGPTLNRRIRIRRTRNLISNTCIQVRSSTRSNNSSSQNRNSKRRRSHLRRTKATRTLLRSRHRRRSRPNLSSRNSSRRSSIIRRNHPRRKTKDRRLNMILRTSRIRLAKSTIPINRKYNRNRTSTMMSRSTKRGSRQNSRRMKARLTLP